jgi:hypothetical protein
MMKPDWARPSDTQVRTAIHALSPARIFFWSFALFFIGLAVAPAQPDIVFSWSAVVFYLLSIGMAFIGIALALRWRVKRCMFSTWADRFDWSVAARRCVTLATVGVVLAIVDRYLLRGVSYADDIFEARSLIEDAGTGPVAILAALFSSFAAFGWISVRLSRTLGHPVGRLIEIVALADLVAYMWLSVALGSRSLVLACALLHVLAFVFLRRLQGTRMSASAIGTGIVLFFGLIITLTHLLQQRLEQMGVSALESIQFSAYAFTLKPDPVVLDFIVRYDLAELGAAVYSIVLYVFHGFYEFLLLFDEYRGEVSWGAQLLWLPIKLVGTITPMSESIDLELFGYRSGVFTTFAGPFFVDFGDLAPLFILLVFFLLGLPFRKLAGGDPRWFFAVLQIAVIIAFAPIFPLLNSAVGMYLLVAAVSMVALIPRRQIRVELQ